MVTTDRNPVFVSCLADCVWQWIYISLTTSQPFRPSSSFNDYLPIVRVLKYPMESETAPFPLQTRFFSNVLLIITWIRERSMIFWHAHFTVSEGSINLQCNMSQDLIKVYCSLSISLFYLCSTFSVLKLKLKLFQHFLSRDWIRRIGKNEKWYKYYLFFWKGPKHATNQ